MASIGKESVIARFYKIAGVVIFVLSIVFAIVVVSSLSPGEPAGPGDFVGAIIQSEAVIGALATLRWFVAIAIIGSGFSFGLLSYGVGEILGRIGANRVSS